MAVGDKYRTVHQRSLSDPEGFWAEQAKAIDWTRRWDKVLDDGKAPFYRWFAGGELNTCHNALDRHMEGGRAEQTALIYDSPVTGTKKSFTYRELRDQVAKLAGAIAAQGVGKGDRVIIYMPMIPEAVMAMLACARLGAVHSVVFGGFAANELATRIDDCAPKLVLTASCGIEPGRVVQYKPLLDQAIELAQHKIPRCLVFQRPQAEASMVKGRDLDWNEAVAAAEPHACVPVKATDPLYILYTSGTTMAVLKKATGPMRSRTSWTTSRTVSSLGRSTPAFSTRKPNGTWPLSSSATPITAHSATSLWLPNTSSIWPVERRWPATLITSSTRVITET